jgi:hypothetical protein
MSAGSSCRAAGGAVHVWAGRGRHICRGPGLPTAPRRATRCPASTPAPPPLRRPLPKGTLVLLPLVHKCRMLGCAYILAGWDVNGSVSKQAFAELGELLSQALFSRLVVQLRQDWFKLLADGAPMQAAASTADGSTGEGPPRPSPPQGPYMPPAGPPGFLAAGHGHWGAPGPGWRLLPSSSAQCSARGPQRPRLRARARAPALKQASRAAPGDVTPPDLARSRRCRLAPQCQAPWTAPCRSSAPPPCPTTARCPAAWRCRRWTPWPLQAPPRPPSSPGPPPTARPLSAPPACPRQHWLALARQGRGRRQATPRSSGWGSWWWCPSWAGCSGTPATGASRCSASRAR